MKLAIFAASAVIGVASLTTAALAQSDATITMSRSAQPNVATAVTYGISTTTLPRELESARPLAGMHPEQPSGPIQGSSGSATTEVTPGGDIRGGLRSE